MRPYPEEIVKILQTGIAAHLLPEVQSAYGRAQFTFGMLLFTIAQRDIDTAVPDLIAANERLRQMLAAADAALAGGQAAGARDARAAIAALPVEAGSLKLSDLRAENDALRGAICALAPLIEPAAEDESLAALLDVRGEIFAWLSADAKKRIVPILTV